MVASNCRLDFRGFMAILNTSMNTSIFRIPRFFSPLLTSLTVNLLSANSSMNTSIFLHTRIFPALNFADGNFTVGNFAAWHFTITFDA